MKATCNVKFVRVFVVAAILAGLVLGSWGNNSAKAVSAAFNQSEPGIMPGTPVIAQGDSVHVTMSQVASPIPFDLTLSLMDTNPLGYPTSVPDDIMTPIDIDESSESSGIEIAASNYYVQPILFVPNNLMPNPYGLRYIDQRMQLIQQWYAEQMRGTTFTTLPAILIQGSQSLAYYYGNCYPPDSSCSWPYEMWSRVFSDLNGLGYPWQSNRILGVFFQNNGMGAPALGGSGEFLVALDADNNRINGDCLEPGCAASVSKGGAAHELGHAFGLPHTYDDPEGSPGKSLMNYGFYGFPQCTLVNSNLNPERDLLFSSPFFNNQIGLMNGGFEDCIPNWSVDSGATYCATLRRSGLYSLALSVSPTAPVRVSQRISVNGSRPYDISGWINSSSLANFQVTLQVVARDSEDQVLDSRILADLQGAAEGWQRISNSYITPSQANSLQVLINAESSGSADIFVDDFDVHESLYVPPIPLQFFHTDGDTVEGDQPTLMWDDVTSATTFQIQVAKDRSFGMMIIDDEITNPTYQIPVPVDEGSRYFWRVRATNAIGSSDWSSAWSFLTVPSQDYFSDEYETSVLSSSWTWIREDPANWNISGPLGRRSQGYLGIALQEGDLAGSSNDAENLLLKDPPLGPYDISTKIDFWEPGPYVNFQQAGLLIYQDDANYMKLYRSYDNGNWLTWQVEVNEEIVETTSIPIWTNPPIRITWDGYTYVPQYSADGIHWSKIGYPVNVEWSSPKIGVAAYRGSGTQQITAYFDYFRVSMPPRFNDVPFDYWAWNWIEWFYNNGITGGCAVSPLRYCPDNSVTRAQMAVFLLKAKFGSDYLPPAASGTLFSDVPASHWAGAWIEQLAAEGITTGCAASKYCPQNPVTRAQMAVFLLKAKYGSTYAPPPATGVFGDVPVSHWAAAWIEQLAAEGITTGCSTGMYCPQRSVTRAQMAVFIDKAFGFPLLP